jgi:hypothetical protein
VTTLGGVVGGVVVFLVGFALGAWAVARGVGMDMRAAGFSEEDLQRIFWGGRRRR